MTDAGMILGTAAYMSPEQARGKTVDKRSDIWSFGVVVYEMLTGRRLFGGETVSDTLAAVLRDPVDLAVLPLETPANVRRLLSRCLERDGKHRLRDIGEARIALDGNVDPTEAAVATATRRRPVLPWLVAGLTGAGLIVAIAIWAPWWSRTSAVAPMRLRVLNGTGAAINSGGGNGTPVAISPDGTVLAFVASRDPANGVPKQLFVRRLDQLEATPLAGTDDANHPFFSPDGRSLGFLAHSKLKRVPASGGAVVTLCDAVNPRGATWMDDDTIVFAPVVGSTGLMRIPAAGGSPSSFVERRPGMLTVRWPQALPDGRGVLYTEHTDITDFDSANLVVAPSGGEPKTVVRGGYGGRYLTSGHLLYVHQGKIMAVRFDLARLEVLGQAVPVIEGAVADTNTGSVQFGVSSTGTLVYVAGAVESQESPIDWMTRDGTVAPLRVTPSIWMNPQFSPDGQKLAMDISDGRQRDLFIYEWAGDRLTQLTFDPSNERAPVWSPDGTRITFASDRARSGIGNLYSIRADGTGDLQRLTDSPLDQRPGSWDPTGRRLVFEEGDLTRSASVMILPMTGDAAAGLKTGRPTVFTEVPFANTFASRWMCLSPTYSPDGRWILYRGQGGVYVRSATGAGMWKVASGTGDLSGGGLFPRWSPNGRELLVLTGMRVLVVPYTVSGNEFRAGAPGLWSPTAYQLFGLKDAPYAMHPDGKRLAILAQRAPAVRTSDDVVFVFNFFDELP